MAEHVIPHFQNDPGLPSIEIGAKKFMCVGATPPFDHPHVFLDMGDENEIVCPYCSTLYRFDPGLDPHAARPEECALPLTAIALVVFVAMMFLYWPLVGIEIALPNGPGP